MNKIKHFLYKIQLFFEHNEKCQVMMYLLSTSLVTLILIIYVVFFIKRPLTMNNWIILFLNVMLLSLLLIDSSHFRVIKDQRKELDARKRLITDYISSVEPDYDCPYIKETHFIKPNGDGEYIRHVKLLYSGSNTMWYSLDLGSTSTESNFDNFHIRAFTSPGRNPLARITFPKANKKLQTIVILEPPLSLNNNEVELDIEADWPGIWKPLVTKPYHDDGRLMLYKEVLLLSFEFFPPKNSKIINFKLEDSINDASVKTEYRPDGSVECIIDKPPRGIISYSFDLEN